MEFWELALEDGSSVEFRELALGDGSSVEFRELAQEDGSNVEFRELALEGGNKGWGISGKFGTALGIDASMVECCICCSQGDANKPGGGRSKDCCCKKG